MAMLDDIKVDFKQCGSDQEEKKPEPDNNDDDQNEQEAEFQACNKLQCDGTCEILLDLFLKLFRSII